jgi:methylmalonyl-CoA mutase C-terminal domain/subunit
VPANHDPASRISPPLPKRGGPRPGAGAPRGNLNGLKSGKYSQRVKALRLALQTIPATADTIRRIDAAGRGNTALLARALHHYADLLILAQAMGQSTDPAQIAPAGIRQLIDRAKSNQPINQGLPPTPSRRHNLPAMTNERPIRVLIAKPGLDGHDRGAKVVARALRDAGMEVIYTGIRQTPEMIAEAALQEDVDVIGLSILSGAHLELFPRVVQALKDRGVDPSEVLLFAGGIIPDEDIPALKQLGFHEIYRPGASTRDIIAYVRQWAAERGLVAAAVESGPAGGP